MKKVLPVFALVATTAIATAIPQDTAKAQATDPFLAQVMYTAANFCPRGWAPMDGRTLPIAQNQALFSLLGTEYGGDGMTTFQIPKVVQFRTGNGQTFMACMALQGIFPPRD